MKINRKKVDSVHLDIFSGRNISSEQKELTDIFVYHLSTWKYTFTRTHTVPARLFSWPSNILLHSKKFYMSHVCFLWYIYTKFYV